VTTVWTQPANATQVGEGGERQKDDDPDIGERSGFVEDVADGRSDQEGVGGDH
jgi:hypothetical protein